MTRLLIIGAFLCSSLFSVTQPITKEAKQRADAIVKKMTLEEKVSYLSGATSFSLRAIPRVGIPTVLLADGPGDCVIMRLIARSILLQSLVLQHGTAVSSIALA